MVVAIPQKNKEGLKNRSLHCATLRLAPHCSGRNDTRRAGFTLVDPGSGSGVTSLYKGFTLVDPGSESGVTSLYKGFTLVELMIVVAILGILAAIVIPEFQGLIQQAKEAAAKDAPQDYLVCALRRSSSCNFRSSSVPFFQ